MPSYIEKAEPVTLPVIALRGTVAFPQITVNFEAGDENASAAAKAAAAGTSFLFLTSYKEYQTDDPEEEFPFGGYEVSRASHWYNISETVPKSEKALLDWFWKAVHEEG
jgi:ATP-dependent Lon protease